MSAVAVTKMHGAFNDFVILDRRGAPELDLAPFARAVCERRGGIGADGLIALFGSQRCDVRVSVLNADGSEAEMCGNGLRCAVRYLSEAGEGDRITCETASGIVDSEIVEKGAAYRVRSAIGVPVLEPRALPFSNAAFVRVGNSHVVIFERSVDALDLETVARALQSRFPGGINVHLAAIRGHSALEVRHYERGVGLTQACGTGAVASAAAAIVRNAVASPVEVRVPGGVLDVEWDGVGAAYLTGPAVRVFDATLHAVHATPA